MLNKLKSNWLKVSIYMVIALLFIYLLLNTDFDEMLEHIKRIKIEILSILILLQCFTQYLLGIQWNRITKNITGKSKFSKIFYILSTGSVIEALTPGAKIGGEVTRLHYLKKEMNIDTKEATNIIIVQKSISMSVLFSISIISMLYLFMTVSMGLPLLTKVLLILLSLIILAFLIVILCYSHILIAICKARPSRISKKICPYVESYNKSIEMLPRREWLLQFLISIAVWILFPLKMLILSRSMGVDNHFLVLLALTMTAYMIGTLPLTPGGIGTFEGTMLSLLALIAVEQAVAVTITMVFRIITFWLVMLISLVYTLIYQRLRKDQIKDEGSDKK